MRGTAFSGLTAAVVLTLAVSAISAAAAFANENPHIKIAAPRTSTRVRTITFTGATTAEFPNLRAYWERGKSDLRVHIRGQAEVGA